MLTIPSRGTRRIIIHKLSTVEFMKDDMTILPAYSPAPSTFCLSSESKADAHELPTPLPPLPDLPGHISQSTPSPTETAESWHSSRSSFSRLVADDAAQRPHSRGTYALR